MTHKSLVLTLLSLILVSAAFPATHAEPIVDLALGSPLVADFNADDGGWTANPPAPPARPEGATTWEWGVPTSGPGAAASGSKVWATNLEGVYVARECMALMSPPIDLSAASSASVSFMQWRHMEESTSSTGFALDAGMLFVTGDDGFTLTKVAPTTGYNSKKIGSTARSCLDGASDPTHGLSGPAGSTVPPSNYSMVSADLSSFAGHSVRFLIAFASDSSVHRAGWYVDDFTVTVDGVSTVEDFEADDGGFTLVSTAKPIQPLGFSWGVPAEGPGSDSPMWATNPAGDYGHKECAWVESPAFQLGDVADPGLGVLKATLTWNQWFRANSLYAAGIIQVGVHDGESVAYETIEPVGGYNSDVDGTYADQLMACLGVELDAPAFAGTIDSEGAAMRPYQADLSAFVGQQISVRFLFASAWSNLNPTVYPGWYIDDVVVDQTLLVEGPDVDPVVEGLLAAQAMPPGWSNGGTDSTWAWGVAEVGPVGELVLGTNLTGNHSADECSWVETPAIPGALLGVDPTLAFDHWYDIYPASTLGAAWSGAAVFVSTDDGATWDYLELDAYNLEARYTDTRNCIQSLDPTVPSSSPYPKVFSGQHEEWETMSVDLSEYADATTVKVRFMFSSGISIFREGYYLRNVEMAGVKVL